MARHDDDDGQQEGGELLGDGAVIAEAAEGQGDEEGQDRDDDLLHNAQDDVLKMGSNATRMLMVAIIVAYASTVLATLMSMIAGYVLVPFLPIASGR